jgi:hypothetical protein
VVLSTAVMGAAVLMLESLLAPALSSRGVALDEFMVPGQPFFLGFPVILLLFAVGYLILGVVTFRANALCWFASVLLIISAPMIVLGLAFLPGPVVTAQWLRGHVDDPEVRLVDVSFKKEGYTAGHIPNAVFVDWRTDLADPDKKHYFILPPQDFELPRRCLRKRKSNKTSRLSYFIAMKACTPPSTGS